MTGKKPPAVLEHLDGNVCLSRPLYLEGKGIIEEFSNDPDSGKQQSTTSKGEVVVDPRFRKKG